MLFACEIRIIAHKADNGEYNQLNKLDYFIAPTYQIGLSISVSALALRHDAVTLSIIGERREKNWYMPVFSLGGHRFESRPETLSGSDLDALESVKKIP